MPSGYFFHADDILRRRAWTTESGQTLRALQRLGVTLVLFGILYGTAMGTFGGIRGDRLLQVVYSGVKVPLLLIATFAIGLPSFFVINTLFGLRGDLNQAIRALVATQAGLAIILASLAPLTLLWYASSSDYPSAILVNGVAFGVASMTAQGLLRAYYRPLIARNHRHRWVLRAWIVVYVFVGIQMGWVLRPFIGRPDAPVEFFREESWGNAYVVVARLIYETLFRW